MMGVLMALGWLLLTLLKIASGLLLILSLIHISLEDNDDVQNVWHSLENEEDLPE